MLYIKMMSDEEMSDLCPFKNFTIIPVSQKESFQFGEFGPAYENKYTEEYADRVRGGNREVLSILRENGDVQSYRITGNVFVMNEAGKTIASRNITPSDYQP
jgi:hypothetical protein